MDVEEREPAPSVATSKDPMRQRMTYWALAAVFVIGVVAIGVVSRADNKDSVAGSGGLPKLAIGSSGALGEAAMSADRSMMPYQQVEYRLADGIAEPPMQATAYRLADPTEDDVAGLAKALGLNGEVKDAAEATANRGAPDEAQKGQGWVVEDGKRTLQVQRGNGSSWWFSAEDPNTAVSSSPAVEKCEMPRCPEGAACTQVCESPEYVEPQRPTDLPDKAEAERVGVEVLEKIGASSGKVTVDDGFTSWVVSRVPVVDGKPITGQTTSVAVGSKSAIVNGYGMLGKPAALGDYPLVGLQAGFERLKSGYGGPGCPNCRTLEATADQATTDEATTDEATTNTGSGSGSAEPPPQPSEPPTPVEPDGGNGGGSGSSGSPGVAPGEPPAACDAAADCVPPDTTPPGPPPPPKVVTITAVKLGVQTYNDLLVPIYVFTTDEGHDVTAIAVTDEYIEQASPTPEPEPMPMPADGGATEPQVDPAEPAKE